MNKMQSRFMKTFVDTSRQQIDQNGDSSEDGSRKSSPHQPVVDNLHSVTLKPQPTKWLDIDSLKQMHVKEDQTAEGTSSNLEGIGAVLKEQESKSEIVRHSDKYDGGECSESKSHTLIEENDLNPPSKLVTKLDCGDVVLKEQTRLALYKQTIKSS